jgi:hypothetical protein
MLELTLAPSFRTASAIYAPYLSGIELVMQPS